MTTTHDWLFRGEHLRMAAKHLRVKAEVMMREADSYDHLANSAWRVDQQTASPEKSKQIPHPMNLKSLPQGKDEG